MFPLTSTPPRQLASSSHLTTLRLLANPRKHKVATHGRL